MPVGYRVSISPDSKTLSCTVRGVTFAGREKKIKVSDFVVESIFLQHQLPGSVLLQVRLLQPAQARVFELKKYLDKPDRLVIDIIRSDLEIKEKDKRKKERGLKAAGIPVVVIDPGHGGEDPGAVGPRGTKEKDIVLEIGKKLKRLLDQEPGIRAFLTRRGDYFIPLVDRVRIAREYGADLFVSLHCNGGRKRYLRGTSVYCLSPKGASDVAGRLLADQENASDRIGGIFPEQGSTKILDSVLVDLTQTHAINTSLQFGGMTLGELARVNVLQFHAPRQAEFAVLKAPDFPSVLVECAYLTNPAEELRLGKNRELLTILVWRKGRRPGPGKLESEF
ncbi:MAG: N-acetylmuramoyl-L-alanine amidase [Deltaproteobacteria bacterium]|nr:N-acetylmuramoyl-L-alanine amidase [Deltaproteobacteria bacterium]